MKPAPWILADQGPSEKDLSEVMELVCVKTIDRLGRCSVVKVFAAQAKGPDLESSEPP